MSAIKQPKRPYSPKIVEEMREDKTHVSDFESLLQTPLQQDGDDRPCQPTSTPGLESGERSSSATGSRVRAGAGSKAKSATTSRAKARPKRGSDVAQLETRGLDDKLPAELRESKKRLQAARDAAKTHRGRLTFD